MKIFKLGGLGFDSNIYLIEDEITALVDAGTGVHFQSITEEMKKLGFGPSDVRLLINTHCHFDHAGGDADFVKASGCGVAIHGIEKGLLESGDGLITCAATFGEKFRPVKVSRELKEGSTIELGKSSLKILHTPGHTAGSICLYDPDEKVLFSGDTVFCEGVGRTDLPTGSNAELMRSLERLKTLDVEKLYPGHGPAAERDGAKYILDAIELVKSLGEP